MHKKLNIILVALFCLLLPISAFAVTYGKTGESSNFNGDVGVPSGGGYYINGVAFQLSDLSDVGVTTPTNTYVLVADGDSWESRALADGDIPNTITISDLQVELDAGAHTIGFTQQTITYDVTTTTVDWTLGNKATVTLTGNVGTFAFTNPTNPCNILVKIVQDATGSRLVTAWDADIKWVGGTAPTLTTTAAGIDICSFYWDGTNYFGVASLAFATP